MLIAFFKSLRDLFRPRILGFVIAIPMASAFIWFVGVTLLYQFLGPTLDSYVQQLTWLTEGAQDNAFLSFVLTYGPSALVIVILLLLMFPLTLWTSLILMAVFAMPWILRILKPSYPNAFRSNERVSLLSTWRISLSVFAKAVPIYLVLVLLIWVPQVWVVGTFILSAWVNAFFIASEVLSELTDEANLKTWIRDHRGPLFGMGAVMMGLLVIPVVQLITPVLGGLWVAHYILADLARKRS